MPVNPSSAAPMSSEQAPIDARADRLRHRIACALLITLVVYMLARELAIAPLRPGGSLLALKALPFVLALPGVLRRRLYTFQWTALLVLVYVALGIVSGMSDAKPVSRWAGWAEALIASGYFVAALAYVRPYKRAHKAKLRAAQVAAAQPEESTRP